MTGNLAREAGEVKARSAEGERDRVGTLHLFPNCTVRCQ